MSKANCTTIRRELDELTLGDDYSANLLAHLKECNECRAFETTQTKLRQIVGSLGTVAAPPDFDFRLRSRIATDNSRSSFHFGALGILSQKSAAVGLGLVLLIAAAAGVRYLTHRSKSNEGIAKSTGPEQVKPVESQKRLPTESTLSREKTSTQASAVSVAAFTNTTNRKYSTTGGRVKRPLATVDSTFEQAPVVGLNSTAQNAVIPIDASQQSLKVSLFDGRGNPRTISVPAVTFGSQRVVPTTTSYAPKGVW